MMLLLNLTKYLLQILIGLPLYAVGFASFWPIVLLCPHVISIGICAFIRSGAECNCLTWVGRKTHTYITIIMGIYLSPHIFFVSFNILSGHMWFASSIRSLCAWDACYDNSLFLDVVNHEYSWIELLVYVTYWLP